MSNAQSKNPAKPVATLFVCRICGEQRRDAEGNKLPNPAAVQLAEDLTEQLEGSDVQVKLHSCLGVCTKPIAWALRAEDRHTFTFAPAALASDIAATARVYIELPPREKMGKKMMPRTVAETLISRIPPLPEEN